jgi:hypothetical protein
MLNIEDVAAAYLHISAMVAPSVLNTCWVKNGQILHRRGEQLPLLLFLRNESVLGH